MKNILNVTKAALVASVTSLHALSVTDEELEPIVVTASRLPELQTQTSSSVELIDAEDRERRQQPRLQDALNMAPGVIATSTSGQEGQTGTLIIRGLTTKYNQIMMDGVRVSDSVTNGSYGNILGNFAMGANENIEIAKSGQNVVHGNATTGGLIGIYESFADHAPRNTFSQEVGSYEYTRSQVSSKGSEGDLKYYLNLNSENYEQDLVAASAYQVANKHASMGVQYALSDEHALKFTARTQQSDLENSANAVNIGMDFQLYSVQFLTTIEDFYKSALVLGYYTEDYHYNKSIFNKHYDKFSLTFDNTFTFSDAFSVNAGLDSSVNEYKQGGWGAKDTSWESYAAYAGLNLRKGATLMNMAARLEDRSDYGSLPSYEASIRHTVEPLKTDVFMRASYGVSAPTLLQTNAFPATGQLANHDLSEEVVKSVELGLTYELNKTNTFGATVYGSSIKNAIVASYNADYTSQFNNTAGTAHVYGVESYVKGVSFGNWHYGVSWNYSIQNESLNIPRNTLNADLAYVTDQWSVGTGIEHRTKATYGGFQALDSYVTTRLYGQYQVTDSLKVNARVENLFDQEYEVNPFPFSASDIQLAKGASAYVGLTYEW